MKRMEKASKRPNDMNLRDAFSPVPPEIRQLVADAALSVREEEGARAQGEVPAKKLRKPLVVLIAALSALVGLSSALAVSELVGWTDFFSRFDGSATPSQMQDALLDTEHTTYALGPVVFTVQEALCDGKMLMTSVSAKAEGDALLFFDGDMSSEIFDPSELTRLQLPAGTTYLEAARQKGLSLYAVRAVAEVDAALCDGEQYAEYLYDAEGRLVALTALPLNDRAGEQVPATFSLYVREIDPQTQTTRQEWQDAPQYAVPVRREVLAEKTYFPEREIALDGFTLDSVRMELRVTGAYVEIAFTASGDASPNDGDALGACFDVELTDEAGGSLPGGVSMSIDCDDSAWPAVVRSETVMLDALPDTVGVRLRYDAPETYLLK